MLLLKRYLPMIKIKIFLLILLSTSISASTPNFVGEELKYSVGFRLFPAGNAILSLTSDSLNGKPVLLLSTSVKTNSFLDAFYTVRDETLSWLNIEDFSLLKQLKKFEKGNITAIIQHTHKEIASLFGIKNILPLQSQFMTLLPLFIFYGVRNYHWEIHFIFYLPVRKR